MVNHAQFETMRCNSSAVCSCLFPLFTLQLGNWMMINCHLREVGGEFEAFGLLRGRDHFLFAQAGSC